MQLGAYCLCMELASASLHRYCAVNLLTAPLPPCSRILGHSELGKHKGVQLLVPVAEGAAGGTGMRVGAAPMQHKVVACGKGMARRWAARCNQQRSRIGACNELKSTSMACGLGVAQQFTGTGCMPERSAPRRSKSGEDRTYHRRSQLRIEGKAGQGANLGGMKGGRGQQPSTAAARGTLAAGFGGLCASMAAQQAARQSDCPSSHACSNSYPANEHTHLEASTEGWPSTPTHRSPAGTPLTGQALRCQPCWPLHWLPHRQRQRCMGCCQPLLQGWTPQGWTGQPC